MVSPGARAAARVAGRITRYLLFGVGPADPLALIAVAALVIGIALIACYIPGRRAANLDPMVPLRYK